MTAVILILIVVLAGSVYCFLKTPFNKPPDIRKDSAEAWDKHFNNWKNKID